MRVQDTNDLTIFGSRGRIRVPRPYGVGDDLAIEIAVVDEEPRTITFHDSAPYALEAEATARVLADGAVEAAEMTLDESLAAARTLDRWRAAIGLRYPFEAEDADVPTVSGAR